MLYDKYLLQNKEAKSKDIILIEKYLLKNSITTGSSGISAEEPWDYGKKKKKRPLDVKIVKRLEDSIDISAEEIIDALGGEEFFKDFKTFKEAKNYINTNVSLILKVFRASKNDIPWGEIDKILKGKLRLK